MSAVNADCDSNDVGLPTDNVDQPTWRENMLQKRLLRKRNEKLQRISKEKGEAEFEFNVASAMLSNADNLPPSDIISDGIGEEFGNISAEVPVLPKPNSWDPDPPRSREDYVMIGSAVGALAEDIMSWEDRGVACLVFKADPI